MKYLKVSIDKLVKIEGLTIIGVFIALMILFIISAPRVFTGYRIYMSFLQTVPPLLILALGLTLVITAGEMDLSFSAIIAFSGFIFCYVFRTFGTPWLAFILALSSGALVGFINGWMVAKVGIPSIMATLAAQFFWNGLTILLSGGLSWNIKEIRPYFIHTLFVGRIGGLVPAQSIWGIAVAVFLWFILNRHTFGEKILFIGDNEEVAKVMGVNVIATKIRNNICFRRSFINFRDDKFLDNPGRGTSFTYYGSSLYRRDLYRRRIWNDHRKFFWCLYCRFFGSRSGCQRNWGILDTFGYRSGNGCFGQFKYYIKSRKRGRDKRENKRICVY